MAKIEEDEVRLLFSNGEVSDYMPRERAAFIVAFTPAGERPKIIEGSDKRYKFAPTRDINLHLKGRNR